LIIARRHHINSTILDTPYREKLTTFIHQHRGVLNAYADRNERYRNYCTEHDPTRLEALNMVQPPDRPQEKKQEHASYGYPSVVIPAHITQ